MSEATPASDTPENTPAPSDSISGTSEPAETSEGNSANREAAKYRTKLRDAEAKLEAAEKRISDMQRKEIEKYAGGKLAVGSDLLDIGGVAVADLLSPDGEVDTETVDAAVEALLTKRPGLRNGPAPWGDVGGGYRQSAPTDTGPTMLQALKFPRR